MGPARFHCATLLYDYRRENLTYLMKRYDVTVAIAYCISHLVILTRLSLRSSSDMDHLAIALEASLPENALYDPPRPYTSAQRE